MNAPIQTPSDALVEVMASYRYEMTPFEAKAWHSIIDAVAPDRFLAFLTHHYQSSPFAPKPSDASKALDVSTDPAVGFSRLERLVIDIGPYQAPPLDDPILITAIQLLGGWVRVCEDCPDPSDSHAVRRFKERFDACFTQALVRVRIDKEMPTQALVAIGGQPRIALAAPDRRPQIQQRRG